MGRRDLLRYKKGDLLRNKKGDRLRYRSSRGREAVARR